MTKHPPHSNILSLHDVFTNKKTRVENAAQFGKTRFNAGDAKPLSHVMLSIPVIIKMDSRLLKLHICCRLVKEQAHNASANTEDANLVYCYVMVISTLPRITRGFGDSC